MQGLVAVIDFRVLQLHHPLAAVFTREQSDQGLWGVLQAIDNVFLHLQLAGRDVAHCQVVHAVERGAVVGAKLRLAQLEAFLGTLGVKF